jgi:hypothetical protein
MKNAHIVPFIPIITFRHMWKSKRCNWHPSDGFLHHREHIGQSVPIRESRCRLSEDFLHLLLSALDEAGPVDAGEDEALEHACGDVGSMVRRSVVKTKV